MKSLISKAIDKKATEFLDGAKLKIKERVDLKIEEAKKEKLEEAKKEMFECIKSFVYETFVVKAGDKFEGSESLKSIYVPMHLTSNKNVIIYESSSEFNKFWKRIN